MIEVKNLTFCFGKKKALNNLDIEIRKGESMILAGANGAGKSTLLRNICGILMAKNSDIFVDDQRVGAETRKKVAYIPSSLSLYNNLRLKDAISFHGSFYPDFKYQGIGEYQFDMSQKVQALSRGERTLFFLSLALSTSPEYLLLDDVIHFLDPHLRDIFMQTILNLIESNQLGIVIAAQVPLDIEGIVDRVVIMNKGKITLNEELEHLKQTFVRICAPSVPGELPVVFKKEWEGMNEYYIYPMENQPGKNYKVEYLNLSEILRAFIGGEYGTH
jgi:ABC-2 type transport system ATP-binding protein